MPLWDLVFYPREGQRDSPIDFLRANCNPQELARINAKLQGLQALHVADWPKSWYKQVGGLYQMRQGDFRIYFELVNRIIVVCYACRKVSQKAKQTDIKAARRSLENYVVEIDNGRKQERNRNVN